MIETSTLTTIVTIGLALCAVWIIILLVRRDSTTLPRAVIVAVVLGLVFAYLSGTKLEKISFAGVRDDVFPPGEPDYTYEVEDLTPQGGHLRYVFLSFGPKLDVTLDADGKYFHVEKTGSINAVLRRFGLPEVTHGARELASITRNLNDVGIYRWEDYPRGMLTVVRTLCQDKQGFQTYNCINTLTVSPRFPR